MQAAAQPNSKKPGATEIAAAVKDAVRGDVPSHQTDLGAAAVQASADKLNRKCVHDATVHP